MRRRNTRRLSRRTPPPASKAESLYFEAAQPLLQQREIRRRDRHPQQRPRERLKNSAQLELALGVAYYGLRRFDDAAGAFLRTIAIAPEIEQPYVFLGKFLDQIPGRLPEVTKQFIEYETANPASATGYLLHAKALNAQSIEPETARKLLEKAISMNERDAAGALRTGHGLRPRRGTTRMPPREFERAAELDPERSGDALSPLPRLRPPGQAGSGARREREIHAKLVEARSRKRSGKRDSKKGGPPKRTALVSTNSLPDL